MQIYYITFCWNRRLLYDGYIILKDNHKILGCTDESVIMGDEKGFKEVLKDGFIVFYPITNDLFSKYNLEPGFRVQTDFDEGRVMISIRKEYKVQKKQVISRIKKVLKGYPKEIREILEESCLGEE